MNVDGWIQFKIVATVAVRLAIDFTYALPYYIRLSPANMHPDNCYDREKYVDSLHGE